MLVGITLGAAPAQAAANTAPQADDIAAVVPADEPTPLALQASDDDSDPLVFEIVTPPAHGTLTSCATGGCTYTPTAGYVGPDSFTWLVKDPTHTSRVATYDLTVEAHASEIVSAGPLTRVQITPQLNCAVDHAGDDVDVAFFDDTACGTFVVVDGTLYSPHTVPGAGGATGTPFTAISQSGVTGTGTAADPFSIVTTVAAGSTGVQLVQTDTYVTGQESYRTEVQVVNSAVARTVRLYRAGDCYLGGDAGYGATGVNGAVSCVSSATSDANRVEQLLPVSPGSHHYEARYDQVWDAIRSRQVLSDGCRCAEFVDNAIALQWDVTLAANSSSTRSSLVTFSQDGVLPLTTTTTVDHGSVAFGTTVHYTVTVNNPGQVDARVTEISDLLPTGFTYVASSTTGASTADPVLDDEWMRWPLDATVPPGGSLTVTFAATAPGVRGIYYNAADAVAPDLFVEGSGASARVRVSSPGNETLEAFGDNAVTAEDAPVLVDVLANDHDTISTTLTIAGFSEPDHGSLTCAATCTYTPAPNYNGPDSFDYTVDNGRGGVDLASVRITVTPVNDTPAAVDDDVTTPEDVAVVVKVLANDSDIDIDPLTAVRRTTPAHGTATCTTTCTYTPTKNFNGTDSFGYTVNDGHGGTANGTVTITVTPVNDAPDAVNDSATLNEDNARTVSVLLNDTDVDGDALSVTGKTNPAHGQVTCGASTCTYTPNANYAGPDSFGYTISDGNGGADSATVTLSVAAVNDVPVANGDTVTVIAGVPKSVSVLVNDTDADNDSLTVIGRTLPEHGTATCTLTACTYTAPVSYSGTDSFGYTVSDGHGGTAGATVTVTVTEPPPVDVRVGLKPIAAAVPVGSAAGWTITVSNTGLVTSAPVVLTDVLPSSFKYQSTTGATCALAGTTLTCNLDGLPALSTRTVVVRGAFVKHGSISDTAVVSVPGDILTSNNTSTVATGVAGSDCTRVGTFGNDTLAGTSGNDVLCGLAGNDNLNGGSGNDVLYGNEGNDTLTGAAGNDRVDGGAGTDTASFATVRAAVKILASGRATGQGTDTLVAIENLIGSQLSDTITGNNGSNRIDGLGGNDKLTGGLGNDVLYGGAGADTLAGGGGNDTLNGGSGKDRCTQGTGTGRLTSC